MLHTDLALIHEDNYLSIVKTFAEDYDTYEDMFNHSWSKLVYRDFGNKGCAEDPIEVPDQIENYDDSFWKEVASKVSDLYMGDEGDMDDAPLLVRLAWQCAGTYRGTDYRGGCNGARVRFDPEASWPANKGVDKALNLLSKVKDQHNDSVTWADLIILAGTQALQDMGLNLEMPFCPGRVDVTNEEEAKMGSKYLETSFLDAEFGRDGDNRDLNVQIRDRASMMNFTLREMVVLNGGGHSIGKCHVDVSGYEGQWTAEPNTFDNSWFKQVLKVQDSLGILDHEHWQTQDQSNGRTQFVNKMDPSLIMLHSDIAHTKDSVLRKIVTDYAGNNKRFLYDFRDAWLKLVNSDRYGNVCASRSLSPQAKTNDDSEDKDYLSNLAIVLISILGGLLFCVLFAACCYYSGQKDVKHEFKDRRYSSLNA